ncbi:MAG: PIN domain-containing protein [Blastochloris sp.]|nr:PIN domain-containing protein [Blastochloris sp.]
MKEVFVDTSGFYAFLDRTDPFHEVSAKLFLTAEKENWQLITSSFVLHESWALIQARLGWDAVEDWLTSLVIRCEIVWIDQTLYTAAEARTRQARERCLSLTDCSSFEVMLARGCREVIADDAHFVRQGFAMPSLKG